MLQRRTRPRRLETRPTKAKKLATLHRWQHSWPHPSRYSFDTKRFNANSVQQPSVFLPSNEFQHLTTPCLCLKSLTAFRRNLKSHCFQSDFTLVTIHKYNQILISSWQQINHKYLHIYLNHKKWKQPIFGDMSCKFETFHSLDLKTLWNLAQKHMRHLIIKFEIM